MVLQKSKAEEPHGYYGVVEYRAQVEEHVVEEIDRQVSRFISIFQCHNWCIQRVGQITETWLAGFHHFLDMLQKVGRWTEATQDLQSDLAD